MKQWWRNYNAVRMFGLTGTVKVLRNDGKMDGAEVKACFDKVSERQKIRGKPKMSTQQHLKQSLKIVQKDE